MAAVNAFTGSDPAAIGPISRTQAVTPADVDLAFVSRWLYVGGAGTLVVQMLSDPIGTYQTFTAVPAGTQLPIRVTQVRAATGATGIVVGD